MSEIKLGQTFGKEITVEENMLAVNVGSGDVSVYATPMMVAFMEEVSAKCLVQFLEVGMTSVGTHISTSHLAATPKGMKVNAIAEITAIDGRKISFLVKAYDEVGLIGEANHERFIVNRDKFNDKAQIKLK